MRAGSQPVSFIKEIIFKNNRDKCTLAFKAQFMVTLHYVQFLKLES